MPDPPLPRLYDDLAWLWPRLSPLSDYAAEAARIEGLMRDHLGPGPRRVLEFGAGGGHTLVHLSRLAGGQHDCVAADLSDAMLAHCRALIPGIATHVGDMRSLRLGETFDVVLIHDAVDYLLTEADLSRTFGTAALHLRPGGLLLVAPTYTAETFVDGDAATDVAPEAAPEAAPPPAGGDAAPGVTYFTFVHDPDPADTAFEMVLLVLIRDGATRRVEVVEDRHVCGLFPAATWLTLLAEAGFDAEAVGDEDDDGEGAWSMFVGRRG